MTHRISFRTQAGPAQFRDASASKKKANASSPVRRRPTAHVNHWTTTPPGVTLDRSRWEGQAIFHLDIQLSPRKMLRATPATGAIAAHPAPGKCLPRPASTVSKGNQTFGASPPSTSLRGVLASATHITHLLRCVHCLKKHHQR